MNDIMYFIMENHTYNGEYVYCTASWARGFSNGLSTFDYCYLPKTASSDLKESAEIVRSMNEDIKDISAKRLFEIMTSARDAYCGSDSFRFNDNQVAEVLSYNYPEWADEFKQLAEESEVA
jgi:hypothetical protein